MLIILPTDTCYGLAGEFTEQDYLEIYRLKGRGFDKQLALLVEDFDDMKKYIEISDEQIELSKNYPYPWSFLGKRNPEFQLPVWMDSEKYQMLSLRVARACLKNLYPPLIRGDVPKIEGLSGCEIPSDNSPEIPSESPPDKGGRGVSFIPYSRELTKKAQENRKSMNAPERKMWYDILHAEKIRSHKFLRQKPLGEYIVDFYCQELGIVIEIDGESHLGQIEYDQKRTLFLESYGLNVLRFTKKEVMENTEGVYLHICDYIASQKLTPQPPLSGGQIPYSYANPPTPLIRGADTIQLCEPPNPPYQGGRYDTVMRTPQPHLSGGQIRYPLYLTSANFAGMPESKTLAEARGIFPEVEGIDGGICDRPPSDIFSIGEDGELRYVRRNYI